jgi:PAS domain S-box-containing protein
MQSGQKPGTLIASLDLPQSKKSRAEQMEEALRQSERKYRIILEKSPFGVVCFNSQGTVLDFNEKFIEIMGSTREKLLGFNAAHQSTPTVQEAIKKAMAGQLSSVEERYTSVTGGKTTYLRGIFSPLVPGQSPTDVIATIENITDQKEHEKELHKIERLESLGILAGGIAHDFNNILTAIIANISFTQTLLGPTHKAWQYLVEAEKASRRAAELSQQLLTFAKGGQPNRKIICVQPLIREAVSLMLRGSHIRAILEVPDSIHTIEADGGQISQVLNNIIINATQAMPTGGKVTITAANICLSKTNSYGLIAGNYIQVTLKDEGHGIPPQIKKKIFDPYFTTKVAGTGLGLASVYSIILKHGGHISVDSIIGQGTAFTLHLPSTGRSYDEHLIAVSQQSNLPKAGSILVMDDEEMIRDIAEAMLTHLGYNVTTCSNGEEVIEIYREALKSDTPFLAIIVDLTIPGGVGGLKAAEQILAITPAASIIVSSGYSNDPIMANYRKYGFSAAIGKPYSVAEFEMALRSLPQRHHS